MKHTPHRTRAGVSIIEVTIAIVILSIGMLGASGFRYHTAIRSKRAQVQTDGTRAAQALIDTWCGLYGDEGYLPETHLSPLLTVAPSVSGPLPPTGFTELGTYEVIVDDVPFYATLSYNDGEVGFRTLSVVIGWRSDYETGTLSETDKTVNVATCVALAPQ
jgi:prepilin-type N-terminal cleavage/methylation domain-containing protein